MWNISDLVQHLKQELGHKCHGDGLGRIWLNNQESFIWVHIPQRQTIIIQPTGMSLWYNARPAVDTYIQLNTAAWNYWFIFGQQTYPVTLNWCTLKLQWIKAKAVLKHCTSLTPLFPSYTLGLLFTLHTRVNYLQGCFFIYSKMVIITQYSGSIKAARYTGSLRSRLQHQLLPWLANWRH